MLKVLALVGAFLVVLALLFFICKRMGWLHRIDRSIELILKVTSLLILLLILIFAIGVAFNGYESVSGTMRKLVTWLRV